MKRIKAVFLDIDGTLIDGATGPFPDDIALIEAVHEAGHKVFLATGRSLAALPPVLKNARWVDGVIAGCGATVSLYGNIIYRKFVAPELLPEISGLYLKNGKWCVFEGETGIFALGSYLIFDYGEPVYMIGDPGDFRRKYSGEIITKVTMEGFLTSEERAVFEPALRVIEFAAYSEAIVAAESKLRGMDRVLAALGLNRDSAVAIGDSENDIDIVKAAGLGIAMGNSRDALKAAAKAHTGDVGRGGVADALKKYVLNDAETEP
ncbi:MAG: Cof-type HAD-IIB family hydrolase [Spirochaetaceae bacterium]|jgi:HAD superfamily hydrolase (TIGR01484 family)|nr:Cof-type HAD-IIB family hydrolase [Spirochaetaceae bacterium]